MLLLLPLKGFEDSTGLQVKALVLRKKNSWYNGKMNWHHFAQACRQIKVDKTCIKKGCSVLVCYVMWS